MRRWPWRVPWRGLRPRRSTGIDLSPAEFADLLDLVGTELLHWLTDLPTSPATMAARLAATPGLDPSAVLEAINQPPTGPAGDPRTLIALLGQAAKLADETAGHRYLAYVAGGGDLVSALGMLLAYGWNRHGGLIEHAPGLAETEQAMIRWMADLMELPSGSGGVLTSGGSQAIFSAVIAARDHHLRGEHRRGRLYVTDQTHFAIRKAAHLAGLPRDAVVTVSTTDGRHVDVEALDEAIRHDRDHGLLPFLVVGSAGTTGTGDVDDLVRVGEVAHRHGCWFHVDACYGGFFQLTARGRAALTGINTADSIAVDPAKSLFAAFGTYGALLVREVALLERAHTLDEDEDYLERVPHDRANPADLSIELTRPCRGLALWLQVHVHGLDALAQALDTRLDLAHYAYVVLNACAELDVPHCPSLSTVVFGVKDGDDEANRALHRRIHATGTVVLSSTRLHGRYLVRMCILSHRVTLADIDAVLDIILTAAQAPRTATEPAGPPAVGTLAALTRQHSEASGRPAGPPPDSIPVGLSAGFTEGPR
jgi:aromatic-L-amino-acid decarboxylase